MNWQLALQFPARSREDYDRMVALENALCSALEPDSEVDGHDFGGGEMNIFIDTDDPGSVFERCLPFVESSGLALRGAAFRAVADSSYVRVWPRGSSEPFQVL